MTHVTSKLFISLLWTCLISVSAFAQSEGKVVQLKPINATGEVISVFEGADNIVLLKVTKADTAKANFEINEIEILCSFQFGTKPTNGDPKLPGVKAGDKIRMELTGDRVGNQWNYRVFRYWEIKENSSSPKGEKPQK
ncbi:hypothetical protein Oweho_3337 [Owenweeksia hongkongensis DSM 17368]|uniref:DUF5666 domain-containing protein n=1 Tax=Owenweeksia hongkongensis (strain DSM 17368 / CIP 108786 / JCM 12287 / NRRL B-23963 / UST20020801) TaxID=926562 RepID=G8R4X4_OWEHD|nr:hypothetical protein [Owenweeksia hongkongensis]AEV34288.1 hypothetical protein Oweho_3337 [Owenweeksia hongkongensis DSM 17368]